MSKVIKQSLFLNFSLLILIFSAQFAGAQTKTTVSGRIMDSALNVPIAYASVQFVGLPTGTLTDTAGHFYIETNQPVAQVIVVAMAYKTKTYKIVPDKYQTLNIKLPPSIHELAVTVVKPKKYRNKGNPAVALIRKVIDHKSRNEISGYDYFECKKYTKMEFGISNVSEKMENRKSLRKVRFIFKDVDSTKIAGQKILPFYINELFSDFYSRKNPHEQKEIVKANKKIRLADFIDDVGLTHLINYMFQDMDIYNENINLFTNKFMSPASSLAPSLYHYYIIDTLVEDSVKCVRMSFYPRNKEDLLFQGYFYIALDSSYAIKKIDMTTNPNINLNWASGLRVEETYGKVDTGWIIKDENIYAVFKIDQNSKTGIFGEKAVSFQKPVFNKPRPAQFYAGDNYVFHDSTKVTPDFRAKSGFEDLTNSEKQVYSDIDSIKRLFVYKRDMVLAELLTIGYVEMGPVEAGSLFSLISSNDVEGTRVWAGLRTTPMFSNRFNFYTHGGYGFQDKIFKYDFGTIYSLSKTNIYHWPVKSIGVGYGYTTSTPGFNLQDFPSSSFLVSFKRGLDNKIFYDKTFKVDLLDEFFNHFSYDLSVAHLIEAPGGVLSFDLPTGSNQNVTSVPYLQNTTVNLTLRYAPNEKVYQKKEVRIPVTNFPTYTLRFTQGIKNQALQGQFNYESILATASGRLSIPPLGFTDLLLNGGMIFGSVPYPLLFIARANQTYIYDEYSYNLMNFLEFVSDRFIELNIDHSFYGFFFNRIPLFRKLKWREGFAFKILYGGLSAQNNPDHNSGLYMFPENTAGVPITQGLGSVPYIEGSISITNIFKFIRVDLVHRFTYLQNPNVSPIGIRAKIKLDF
jgi:hypothetical protein